MKKWIRWPGVAVFVVIIACIGLFWLFFADMLVKSGIEKAGTRLVGAKVELADADITLFPLGLALTDLQVTNPDKPMRNFVRIDALGVDLNTGRLLSRKILAERAVLKGVRLDTERETSGAIIADDASTPAPVVKKDTSSVFRLPDLDLKDPVEILKKESLQTLTAVEQLKKDIEAEKQRWQEKMRQLPNQETFDAYRSRIERVKENAQSLQGVLGAATEANTIREDIEADLKRLRDVESELKQQMRQYRDRIEALGGLPAKDIARLKEKYALTPEGLGNFTRLILGPKYANWMERGAALYAKIQPLLADRLSAGDQSETAPEPVRGAGVDVHFKSAAAAPEPDFVIRQATADVRTSAGALAGDIRNITNAPPVLGMPTTFSFSGNALNNADSVSVQGELNYVVPGAPKIQLSGQAAGYTIERLQLTGADTGLPITLSGGTLDMKLQMRIEQQNLDAGITTVVRKATFEVGKAGASENAGGVIASAIADTLSGLSRINVLAEMKGTVENPEIAFKSDVDRHLSDALGKIVRKQANLFEKQLKSAVMEKIDQPMSGLNGQVAGLGALQEEVQNRLNKGSGLLGNLAAF